MKYIVYIYVHVFYTLDQHSSVKNYLAIQKRKLLKWYAFTWHLQNMALIVIYLKKKYFIIRPSFKKCLFGIATWEFPDPGGMDFFFQTESLYM